MERSGVVGVNDLAQFFGIEPRRVQQLVKNEGMPLEGRGRYDLLKCAAWYIRWLRTRVERKGGDSDVETKRRDEEYKIKAIDRELKEMERDEARGRLVDVEVVGTMMEGAMERIRAKAIESVSGEADRVIGLKTKRQAIVTLQSIMYGALNVAAAVGEEYDGGNGHAADPEGGREAKGA